MRADIILGLTIHTSFVGVDRIQTLEDRLLSLFGLGAVQAAAVHYAFFAESSQRRRPLRHL